MARATDLRNQRKEFLPVFLTEACHASHHFSSHDFFSQVDFLTASCHFLVFLSMQNLNVFVVAQFKCIPQTHIFTLTYSTILLSNNVIFVLRDMGVEKVTEFPHNFFVLKTGVQKRDCVP